MRIIKFGHSCFLVEEGQARILIDPGRYSSANKLQKINGLSAILLTHEHGDHAHPENIQKILAVNPVLVYGNTATCAALAKSGINSTLFEESVMTIGKMQIEAAPADHGPLIGGAPQNTAYVLRGTNSYFLIPGDSYDEQLARFAGSTILALSITAGWGKEIEAHAFLKRMSPKIVIPAHDGFIQEFYLKNKYHQWSEHCERLGIKFVSLATGEAMEF